MAGTRRLQDPLAYEKGFWSRGVLRVAGVDEAGRGPLAGPVVAAAVILRPGVAVPGARDSKALGASRRRALVADILDKAACVGLGAASVREIERHNILGATRLAMGRALARLAEPPEHVVVDGLWMRDLGWEHEGVVGADRSIHTVACASILAKVVRDSLMERLARRYPGYGWDRNMGYPTPEHRRALRHLGPTPHHRRTFGEVQGFFAF